MAKNQTKAETETKKNPRSVMNPGSSGTDPNKVKQEIQEDLNAGIGAMTSREAGSMRD